MRVGLCRYPEEEPSRQRAKQMQSACEGRLLSQSEKQQRSSKKARKQRKPEWLWEGEAVVREGAGGEARRGPEGLEGAGRFHRGAMESSNFSFGS